MEPNPISHRRRRLRCRPSAVKNRARLNRGKFVILQGARRPPNPQDGWMSERVSERTPAAFCKCWYAVCVAGPFQISHSLARPRFDSPLGSRKTANFLRSNAVFCDNVSVLFCCRGTMKWKKWRIFALFAYFITKFLTSCWQLVKYIKSQP